MRRLVSVALVGLVSACAADGLDEVGSLAREATTCVTVQRGLAGSPAVADSTVYAGIPSSTGGAGSGTNLWTGSTTSGIARALIKWDLPVIPAGYTLTSATANVYVSNANLTTVRVHRVTAPWTESTVTWNSFAGAFDSATIATVTTGGWAIRSFDLTAQVGAWYAGTQPNHGLLLEEDPTTYRTGYASSENGTASRRPSLVVCYSDGATPPPAIDAGTGGGTTPPPPPPPTTIDAGTTVDAGPPPPPPPPGSPTLKIAVIGDYGALGPGLEQVSAMIDDWNVDAIITTGDNVYSSAAQPYDDIVGQFFHEYIGGYSGAYGAGAATNKFWPTLGNHDYDHLAAYLAWFNLPGNERYYDTALDSGNMARLYAFNSDSRDPDGRTQTSVQGQWLQGRLAASTACFDIVALHEPPYGSRLGHDAQPAVRFPYRTWGADVVFAGHMHGYERLLVNGFPHYTIGTSGGGIWGEWTNPSPYSQYRYPVSETGWGAILVTLRVGGGTGELKTEFFAPGNPIAIDTYSFTKVCP